jgi:hypothetical protein
MNQLGYWNKAFDLIGEVVLTKRKPGICPVCGSNNLRRQLIIRGLFTEYDSIDQLDYGWYECDNGHEFEVVPDHVWNGEPHGIKIN